MSSKSPAKTEKPEDSNNENKVRPSLSPRRRRGRSDSRRRSGSRVVERIVRRSSAHVARPMLTRTNYPERALVMEVNFQTLRVWDVVQDGLSDDADDDEYHDDHQAMAGLLRSVPSELWNTLARKDTVKQAWDAVKHLRIGDERARRQRAASCAGSSALSPSRRGKPSATLASASPHSQPTCAPSATTSRMQR